MYSREQVVRVISMIFMVSMAFGINLMDYGISEESAVETVVTFMAVIGILLDVIGYLLRWSKGDVTLGGRLK